jgi:hypothetical protein
MKTTAKTIFLFVFSFMLISLVNAQSALLTSSNSKYLVKDATTGIVLAEFVNLGKAIEHRDQFGIPLGEAALKNVSGKLEVNYTRYELSEQLQHVRKQLQRNSVNENAIYQNNPFLPKQQNYNYQQVAKPVSSNYNYNIYNYNYYKLNK